MHEDELRIVSGIVRAAAAAAMKFHGTADAQTKSDSSLVTAADLAANDVILDGLRTSFPDDSIISEESHDTADRLNARRVWIVDPLDGTREFLAQNGEFSIMLGLVEEGEPVLGVVYMPSTCVLYSAIMGMGAWREENGHRTRLACTQADLSALRLVGSRSHPDPLVERLRVMLDIQDVEPCGSVGVKCGRIAEGRRDLYVHPVPYLKEWDTCAPEVILREAGGWISDCLGERLQYNKPQTAQPHGIVACTPEVAAEILPVLSTLYRTSGSATIA